MKVFYVVLLLMFPQASFAQEKKISDEVFRDVAGELRCPTCTGLSVLDSEAKFSVQIKDEVRSQLERGVAKEKVLEFFQERYGPWILRKPPNEGFNAIVWWIPISLLVLGPVFIWFFVWRKRKVVASFGVRTTAAIIDEMKLATEALRSKKGS